ncbi:hypothetical protein PLESTM_001704400 [Pleodorina starrii]|nr:hypothetical protein PLESTM_001704400 [Pleodorina starrii]
MERLISLSFTVRAKHSCVRACRACRPALPNPFPSLPRRRRRRRARPASVRWCVGTSAQRSSNTPPPPPRRTLYVTYAATDTRALDGMLMGVSAAVVDSDGDVGDVDGGVLQLLLMLMLLMLMLIPLRMGGYVHV